MDEVLSFETKWILFTLWSFATLFMVYFIFETVKWILSQAIGIFVGSLGMHLITFAVFNPLALLSDSSSKLGDQSTRNVIDVAMLCTVCIALFGLALRFLSRPTYQQLIGTFLLWITFAVSNPLALLSDSSSKLGDQSSRNVIDGAIRYIGCVQAPALLGLTLRFLSRPTYQQLIGTFILWIGMICAFREWYDKEKRIHKISYYTNDVQQKIIPLPRRQIRYSNPYNNHDADKISYHTEESAMATVQRMKCQGLPNAHRLTHYYNRYRNAWYVGNRKYDY